MSDSFMFPVKYSVLDLSLGYIVSKCYVIEDTTKYYPDGSSKKLYSVIFPYPSIEEYTDNLYYNYDTKDIGTRNTPKHDFWGGIYNTQSVKKVFDSYFEAYAYSIIKYKELEKKLYSKIPWSHPRYKEEIDNINLKFSLDMKTCEKFERLVFENTTDMKVSGEEINPYEIEDLETRKKHIRILVNNKMKQ